MINEIIGCSIFLGVLVAGKIFGIKGLFKPAIEQTQGNSGCVTCVWWRNKIIYSSYIRICPVTDRIKKEELIRAKRFIKNEKERV